MKKILLLVTFVVGSFAYPNCASCHNGAYKDKLNTLEPKEIVTILNEYKSGARSGMMSGFVSGMSEDDIKESANKFGKK